MDTATVSIGLFSGGQVAPARMTIAKRIARSPSLFMFMMTSFRERTDPLLVANADPTVPHDRRPQPSIDLHWDRRRVCTGDRRAKASYGAACRSIARVGQTAYPTGGTATEGEVAYRVPNRSTCRIRTYRESPPHRTFLGLRQEDRHRKKGRPGRKRGRDQLRSVRQAPKRFLGESAQACPTIEDAM